MREAWAALWEASDRTCGKRLKPLLPTLADGMRRHGLLDLATDVRCGLQSMSAGTADRTLRGVREQAGGRRRRRPAATSSVRRSIPVRTHPDWRNPPPGFVEADLMAHGGPVTRGSFARTPLRAVLGGLREFVPFDLPGFDTDTDSVFMIESVRDYRRDGLQALAPRRGTRSRIRHPGGNGLPCALTELTGSVPCGAIFTSRRNSGRFASG